MPKPEKPYVIDTNILINFDIFTPIQIHTTFWEQLSFAVKHGAIIIIEDVKNECKYGKVKNWVKEQKIISVDNEIQNAAIKINNKYQLITYDDKGNKKSEADPVIIAYAKKNNCAVFTREQKRKSDEDAMKIPDVCDALGIDYERHPIKVFKKLNFKKI